MRVCWIASCASNSRPAATSASPRLSDSRLCCSSFADMRDACHRWKRSSMAIPASSVRECSRTNFRKASTSSSTVLILLSLLFVFAQIKFNYVVPRLPANSREDVSGAHSASPGTDASRPACRHRWAGLFVKIPLPASAPAATELYPCGFQTPMGDAAALFWEGEAPAESQSQPLAEPLSRLPAPSSAADSPPPNLPAAHPPPAANLRNSCDWSPSKSSEEQPCGVWSDVFTATDGDRNDPYRPRGWCRQGRQVQLREQSPGAV